MVFIPAARCCHLSVIAWFLYWYQYPKSFLTEFKLRRINLQRKAFSSRITESSTDLGIFWHAPAYFVPYLLNILQTCWGYPKVTVWKFSVNLLNLSERKRLVKMPFILSGNSLDSHLGVKTSNWIQLVWEVTSVQFGIRFWSVECHSVRFNRYRWQLQYKRLLIHWLV